MSELQNTTYLNLIDCYRPKRRPIRKKKKKTHKIQTALNAYISTCPCFFMMALRANISNLVIAPCS